MKFTEKDNCTTCKHGYFKCFSADGEHNICGAYNCYLCQISYAQCDDYEKGDVPDGEERDECMQADWS